MPELPEIVVFTNTNFAATFGHFSPPGPLYDSSAVALKTHLFRKGTKMSLKDGDSLGAPRRSIAWL